MTGHDVCAILPWIIYALTMCLYVFLVHLMCRPFREWIQQLRVHELEKYTNSQDPKIDL